MKFNYLINLFFYIVHYPDFISPYNEIDDSMYIYSILLYFACVKDPHPVFHQMCNTLSDRSQQAIAAFFENLVKVEKINRNILAKAIFDAGPKSPVRFLQMGSPISTPNNKVRISPPTPNEHKTRIVNSLKLQLDTEQYERGLMEVQLKQYEEKILKLEQSQKTFRTTIQGLKNDLLVKNTENLSPNREFKGEQIIKRLKKDLTDREEKLYNLKVSMENLTESKKSTDEKVRINRNRSTIWLCER